MVVKHASQTKLAPWTVSMSLVAGRVSFGLLSPYFFIATVLGCLSQDDYLPLCGLWLAVVPLVFRHDTVRGTGTKLAAVKRGV